MGIGRPADVGKFSLIVLHLLAVIAGSIAVVSAGTAPAQCILDVVHPSVFPPIVRAEGLDQALADLFAKCSGFGTPGTVTAMDVTLTLNTSVVNSSTPQLVLDQPAPNVFPGTVAGNEIQFNGIPVLAPDLNGFRNFQVTDIRANAQQLFALDPNTNLAITATWSFEGGGTSIQLTPTIIGALTADGPNACTSPVLLNINPPAFLGRFINVNGIDFNALFNVVIPPSGGIGLDLLQVMQVPSGLCTGAAAVLPTGNTLGLNFKAVSLGHQTYLDVQAALTSLMPIAFSVTGGFSSFRLEQAVILDYDLESFVTPDFLKGETIVLSRVIDGHVANPDVCPTLHLHKNAMATGIFIDLVGAFVDQNPGACGYGKVVTVPAPNFP